MYTPFNAITGKEYQGGNIETLTTAAKELGTTDPRWMTFLQAQEHGWKVIKGAKGAKIAVVKEFKDSLDENDEERKTRRFVKHYFVFNATQIHGICNYGESQNQQATQTAFKAQLTFF